MISQTLSANCPQPKIPSPLLFPCFPVYPTLPLDDIVYTTASRRYVCSVCGYVYDPDLGDSTQDVDPGTPFSELPVDCKCPRYRQGQDKFNPA